MTVHNKKSGFYFFIIFQLAEIEKKKKSKIIGTNSKQHLFAEPSVDGLSQSDAGSEWNFVKHQQQRTSKKIESGKSVIVGTETSRDISDEDDRIDENEDNVALLLKRQSALLKRRVKSIRRNDDEDSEVEVNKLGGNSVNGNASYTRQRSRTNTILNLSTSL